jgi:hypothetical protein
MVLGRTFLRLIAPARHGARLRPAVAGGGTADRQGAYRDPWLTT